MIIRTPDQRLRVFVSSTLQELGDERRAARDAIERLHLAPVLFELGARPHPPKDLYRAYLAQSHIFIGIYWQKYGWVAPDMDVSGLEDEYNSSGNRPKLIYIKAPAPDREARLKELLDRVKNDNVSYKYFTTPDELRDSIENDLAMLLSESFEMSQSAEAAPAAASAPGAAMNNLPTPPTRLIGREMELQTLHDWLLRDDIGLVTLTGPGGTGKSRLALQAAIDLRDRFEDGTFFIAFASIADPGLVVSTIAQSLGIHETGDRALLEVVKDQLRPRHSLLVLDNFEQIVAAATLIADVLQACPRLKVLVTSRTPLHVRGEKEFPVPPLAVPEHYRDADMDRLSQYAAVELFIQRAIDLRSDFRVTNDTAPTIAEICRRLDGLPLAIELAAARIRVLSPSALLARLEHSLDLLTSGARDLPARQQTLRNTIAWSYDLLDADAQKLFRRLGVFVGGWTFEAGEAVCNANHDLAIELLDELGILVDNSLLKPPIEIESEPRFGMLSTIREYAHEKLTASGEHAALCDRHAQYYLSLAEVAEADMRQSRQQQWLNRLDDERDNFRAALSWSLEQNNVESVLRIASALWQFWETRGYWTEGLQWLETGLAHEASVPINVRAKALNRAAWLTRNLGNYPKAAETLEESLRLWRQIDDKAGIALALSNLGTTMIRRGHYDEAVATLTESLTLRRQLNDQVGVAASLVNLGLVETERGHHQQAIVYYSESLSIARALGDHDHLIKSLNNLGNVYNLLGEHDRAEAMYREGVSLCHQIGDKYMEALITANLGWLAMLRGRYDDAARSLAEALALFQGMGDREFTLGCLDLMACLAAAQGRPARAAKLWGAEEALRAAIGIEMPDSDRPQHEKWLAEARSQLDAASLATAWAEGRSLKLDQAVAFALSA